MADTKISALPAATLPLAGTEQVPIVQSGDTKKVPVSDLRDAALRAEVEAARGGRSNLDLRISTISDFASANPGGVLNGFYYDQSLTGSNPGTRSCAVGDLFLMPYYTSKSLTIDEIGVSVSTAASGALGRCGIYEAGSDGWPNALLFEGASDLVCSTTGYKAHSASFTFEKAKLYYLAFMAGVAAPTVRSVPTTSQLNFGLVLNSPDGVQYRTCLIRRFQTFAIPFPNPFSFDHVTDLGEGNVQAPSIRMRAVVS